jgi:hypothetical protein
VCPLALAVVLTGAAGAQTFKLAYSNIKSGKGQIARPGCPATFADTSNCTDRTQPMNASGTGIVLQELAKPNADAASGRSASARPRCAAGAACVRRARLEIRRHRARRRFDMLKFKEERTA